MSNYHTIGQRLDILAPAIIARGPVTALSLSQMILGLHNGREDSIELRREVEAWLIRNHHLVYWSVADEGYRLRNGVPVRPVEVQAVLQPRNAHCEIAESDLRGAILAGAVSLSQIAVRLNRPPSQIRKAAHFFGHGRHLRAWVCLIRKGAA